MSNQKNNDAEKAIIGLGKIFKIFALIAVVLIIALCIYLASNSETSTASVINYAFIILDKIQIQMIVAV